MGPPSKENTRSKSNELALERLIVLAEFCSLDIMATMNNGENRRLVPEEQVEFETNRCKSRLQENYPSF